MSGFKCRSMAVAAALAAGVFLVSNKAIPQDEDYESKWDTLADSGNLAPHQPVLNALLEHRTIVIGHDVNAIAVQQVIASLLLLDQRAPGEPIHLYVRSNGGWTSDVFAIIGVIESLKSPVNTYATGDASSAGAMLVAAGTGVRMALPYSTISIHDNISVATDEPYCRDNLDRVKELEFWKRVVKTKLPEEWFKGGEDNFYHLSPQQALEFGLIDQIMASPAGR